MESQLVFKPSVKREDSRMDSHQCKVNKKSYRSQPYDRSPPTSRSSTGTPPSSPDQNNCDEPLGTIGESTMHIGKEQKRYRREDANKRERARMHTVNSAFDHLRQLVPTYPSNRKLSKIETLRLACSYIQDLTKLVNDNNIQSIHGKDVNLMYGGGSELREAGFGGQSGHYPASTGNGTATVPAAYLNPMTTKGEYSTPPEFNSQNFCYQPAYVNSDAESCQSEPDIPSPTHQYNMYMSSTPTGIAVRPPPAISRVSSDSIIAMHMANASIGSNSPTYCAGSPGAGAPCSPLTRAQQHSTSTMSHNSQVTLHCNATPLSSSLQSTPFSNIPIFPHQCYSQ